MVLISVTAGAVIDLILNTILIPVLGASGAAIGTVTAELAVLIIQYLSLKIRYPTLFVGYAFLKFSRRWLWEAPPAAGYSF